MFYTLKTRESIKENEPFKVASTELKATLVLF